MISKCSVSHRIHLKKRYSSFFKRSCTASQASGNVTCKRTVQTLATSITLANTSFILQPTCLLVANTEKRVAKCTQRQHALKSNMQLVSKASLLYRVFSVPPKVIFHVGFIRQEG